MKIQKNVPLAPLTTFGLGGAAKYFVEIENEDELEGAFEFADKNRLPVFVLGGGSNIVVSDDGFSGLVILNSIKGLKSENDTDVAIITAGAGEIWDDVVKLSVQNNWAGIECLSGIPGRAGAAPIQNIGAYGQEIASTIKNIRAFDIRAKKFIDLALEDCEFNYRTSIFNSRKRNRYIVSYITLELKPEGSPTIIYQDLKDQFPDPQNVTLSRFRKAVIETRARKGMVMLPGYETFRSAGSFFKHPIISKEEFEAIRTRHKSESPRPWFWSEPDGQMKLVAAYLIETSGFSRGHRRRNVGISPKHALSLIHHGKGSTQELIQLAKEIQKGVEDAFGVRLMPEPEFVGFEEHPLI